MKNKRLLFGTSMAALALGLAGLCTAQQEASGGKFVGTWKENPAKRTIGALPQRRFRVGSNGGLEEVLGPQSRPLVVPIQFGAKPYSMNNSKNMIEWKRADANHFEEKLYEGDKLLSTSKIELSKDGKTLTDVIERDSSDVTTVVYKNSTADQQGLVGIWKAESVRGGKPAEEKIEPLGANGLLVTTDRGLIRTLTFDGKVNLVTGTAVISGSGEAATLKNPDMIEITVSRDGVPHSTRTMELSANGKTLTETLKRNIGGESSVTVFEKQ
jgi:hypothetical protein